jgi:hypothetical protein
VIADGGKMIRGFLLTLCFILPLFAEKMEIVAYHVGKGTTGEELASDFAHSHYDRDPFEEAGDDPLVLVKRGKVLKGPLFESRFFKEGDRLVDLSELVRLENGKRIEGPLNVVLNETSGKVVVMGTNRSQTIVRNHYLSLEGADSIEYKAEIYDFPRTGLGLLKVNSKSLPESAVKLSEAMFSAFLGGRGEMVSKDWKLEFEGNTSGSDLFLDIRILMNASVDWRGKKDAIHLESRVVTCDGVPSYLELGNVDGGDRTLVLALTATMKLMDGTSAQDEILRETQSLSQAALIRAWLSTLDSEPIPEGNQRIFRQFSVPPTFGEYLSGPATSLDPFEEDEAERVLKPSLLREGLEDVNGILRRGGRIFDYSELFQNQGVKVGKRDFVVLIENSSTIYASLPADQMLLVGAITMSGGPEIPRNVVTEVTLLESEKSFSIEEVNDEGVRVVNRLVVRGRFGDRMIGKNSSNDRILSLTVEPNVGANGEHIDLGLDYHFKKSTGVELNLKTEIPLRSGGAKLTGQHRHGGKYRALLITAHGLGLAEELGEEK